MPTLIDSLIVALTLDPKGFTKGRKETSEGFKKTRDETAATAKDLEVYGKRASSFFSSLRNEAVGLFLAFQGASSVTGFLKDLISGDAATGRLAGNIGMATNALSAWQLAVQSVGGDASEANAALAKMAEERQNFLKFGTVSDPNSFTRLGVTAEDLKNGPEATLLKIAEAAQRLPKNAFYSLAHAVGLSDGVINLLEKGREGTAALIEEKKRDGAATDADADAAAKFQARLAELEAKIKGAVRPELYQLVNTLLDFIDGMERGDKLAPEFELAIYALGTAFAVALGPLGLLSAGIALVITHLSELEKKYAHVVFATHGLIGGRDLYNSMIAAGVKNDADIDRIIDARTAAGGGGATDPYAGMTGAQRTAAIRRTFPGYQPPRDGGRPAGSSSGNYIESFLIGAGFTAEQARGIHAGITAEGGSLGMAKNGAFGIGQWRGARAKALFARYGRAPSMAEQMAFLVSELKGGDVGGAAVRGQSSAAGTLEAYIRAFMRPGPGTEGDLRRGYAALGMTRPRAPTAAGSRSSSTTTSIGTIVIHTTASDADGIAAELPAAIRRRGLAQNANQGLN